MVGLFFAKTYRRLLRFVALRLVARLTVFFFVAFFFFAMLVNFLFVTDSDRDLEQKIF